MSADLILYALVAVVLVFWLRNTLGTRHGGERQRENPLNHTDIPGADKKQGEIMDRGRVIDITDAEPDIEPFNTMRFPGLEIKNEAVPGLMEIMKYDKSFDPYRFVQGAKDAFPMIVEAFAKGDTETLQDLLAPKIYKSFTDGIDARNLRGETIATEIHSVRRVEIIEARLVGRMAYLTVRMTADETSVIRDGQNQIISGNPDRVTELTDVWTFGRVMAAKDPTWLVYETRDDAVEEDGSIDLPEARDH